MIWAAVILLILLFVVFAIYSPRKCIQCGSRELKDWHGMKCCRKCGALQS